MTQIVIVGSGVVGTATGQGFAQVNMPVKFVDINTDRVEALRDAGLGVLDDIDPRPRAFFF